MSIFTKLSFLNHLDSKIEENFFNYQEIINIQKNDLKLIYTIDNLKTFFQLVNNDNLIIFIDDSYNTSKIIFRSLEDIESKYNELNIDNLDNDENFFLRIEVKKRNEFEYKIYSFKHFTLWLCSSDNILSLFEKFKDFKDTNNSINIHILDEENHLFYTDKFIFYSDKNFTTLHHLEINRNNILNNHKENCHYTGLNINCFLPIDFKLIVYSNNDTLNLLFNKLSFLLTLIFIVNISEISENTNNCFLEYKLDGYRSIKNKIEFQTMNINNFEKYYKIFIWIYLDNNNSNISDKIGLSRNVISLHVNNNDIIEINGDLYASIKSNFDIYLKENVHRYLEVKNQVSTFMYDMSLKAENYSNSFADIFKMNFLIFISYFLSIIVVTSVDKGKFVNMFSPEVTAITLLILVISFFYKCFAVKELNEKIKRFEKKYELLKKRYSDILEEENLSNLFTDDEEYNTDITYMKKSLIKFSNLWVGTIISFAVISICFSLINNFKEFIEIIVVLFFSIIGLYFKIKPFF